MGAQKSAEASPDPLGDPARTIEAERHRESPSVLAWLTFLAVLGLKNHVNFWHGE